MVRGPVSAEEFMNETSTFVRRNRPRTDPQPPSTRNATALVIGTRTSHLRRTTVAKARGLPIRSYGVPSLYHLVGQTDLRLLQPEALTRFRGREIRFAEDALSFSTIHQASGSWWLW
jgi:hypothetical protein